MGTTFQLHVQVGGGPPAKAVEQYPITTGGPTDLMHAAVFTTGVELVCVRLLLFVIVTPLPITKSLNALRCGVETYADEEGATKPE